MSEAKFCERKSELLQDPKCAGLFDDQAVQLMTLAQGLACVSRIMAAMAGEENSDAPRNEG